MTRKIVLFLAVLSIVVFWKNFYHLNQDVTRIPLYLCRTNFKPIIWGDIENESLPFLLDTGSCFDISLNKKNFEKIKKKDLKKKITFFDVFGNSYTSSLFSIPKIRINSLILSDQTLLQEVPDFHANTTFPKMNLPHNKYRSAKGSIGWKVFKDFCIFIDPPSSALFLAKTKSVFEKKRIFNEKNYISTPIKYEYGMLTIDLVSPLGVRKFIIDTGTSVCMIRKSLVKADELSEHQNGISIYQSKAFSIGDGTFKNWNFIAADMTDLVGIDGILGIDFLLEHPVLFDFENQMVYIKKPSGIFGTQWQRAKIYISQFILQNFSRYSTT